MFGAIITAARRPGGLQITLKDFNMEIKISRTEMIDAIKKSGYLLEIEIEEILKRKRIYPWMNQVYVDPITAKNREIDITASIGTKISESQYRITFDFVFECENNTNPIIMFKSGNDRTPNQYDVIKLDGIPLLTKTPKNTINRLVEDVIDIGNIEELYDAPTSRQYCTFSKKNNKGPVIALHDDNQHNSFLKIMEYINIHVDDYYKEIAEKLMERNSFIDYRVYMPAIVLGGELFYAENKKTGLDLLPSSHIKYEMNYFWKGREYSQHIDVVTKNGLDKYLDNRVNAIRKMGEISEYKYSKLAYSAKITKKEYQEKKDKINPRYDLESY